MKNKNDERKQYNYKRLFKKTFKQERTQNRRINVYVVERIKKARYLTSCINLRFERKKINR